MRKGRYMAVGISLISLFSFTLVSAAFTKDTMNDKVRKLTWGYFKSLGDQQPQEGGSLNRHKEKPSFVGELPTIEREGYEFLGRYTDPIGGQKITSQTFIDKNVTYYAHWNSQTSNVQFDPNITSPTNTTCNNSSNEGNPTPDEDLKCGSNYHNEHNVCVSNTKTMTCKASLPSHASYVSSTITLKWDTLHSGWISEENCTFQCNENYHLENNQCVSNTSTKTCIQSGAIHLSHYIIEDKEATRNPTTSSWDIPNCKWECYGGVKEDGTCGSHMTYNTQKGEITVWSEDYSYHITIQDKNLGAASVGDAGALYQWGNNYGFTDFKNYSSKPIKQKVSIPYRSSTFIIGYWDWIEYPYHSRNLRGGGLDSPHNNYGYDRASHTVSNVENRQGPCPNGFHVPSRGERKELISIWYSLKHGKANPFTLVPLSNSQEFIDDFHITSTHSRDYVGQENKYLSAYWTSSPFRDYGTDHSWTENIDSSAHAIQMGNNGIKPLGYPIENTREFGQDGTNADTFRASAYNIRCFKNT